MVSYLAKLIAKEEGFGVVGALPTRNHNPGDLRHSPHSVHESRSPNAVGQIDTDEHGWEDLERQLRIYAGPQAKRRVAPDRSLTLREMIVDYYAPEGENDSENYLAFVCEKLHLPDSALVSDALKVADPNPRQALPGDDGAISTVSLPEVHDGV